MSEGCLLGVFGAGVYELSGGCLVNVWKGPEGVLKVSGRCLEGVRS